jgi:hypothetical protein
MGWAFSEKRDAVPYSQKLMKGIETSCLSLTCTIREESTAKVSCCFIPGDQYISPSLAGPKQSRIFLRAKRVHYYGR